MYPLLKPLLFTMEPEKAHKFTVKLLHTVLKIPFGKAIMKSIFGYEHPSLEKELLGLTFKNPVGLAAGFDKNAELIDDFTHLGFGFIEIGTLTPKSQPGNPQPRLFRLPADEALINRMGFNNEGVEAAVERLKKRTSSVIVGGNIGKNKVTPNEQALDDYLISFKKLYEYVDYFAVNVSSPNTPGLRALQEKEPLMRILRALQVENKQRSNKPILLKIAPDLTPEQVEDIIDLTKELGLDGLIVSNTTIDRNDLKTSQEEIEKIGAGGLSGKPVFEKSTSLLRHIKAQLPNVPVIAVGGIVSGKDAVEKLKSGADLVQVYSGMVYRGPALIKEINQAVVTYLKTD